MHVRLDLDGTNTILISANELEAELISRLRTRNCIIDLSSKPITIKLLKKTVDAAIK